MSDRVALVPADWEPLGHSVGPFALDELEVRECREDLSQSLRKWQVRIAARQDVVSVGHVSEHLEYPHDLSSANGIKQAIVFRLCAMTPRSFDKETASLPDAFVF